MKNQILNIGTTLSRVEQKLILGGLGSGAFEESNGKLGKGSLCAKSGTDPRYTCKSNLTCKGSSNSIGVCS